MHNLHYHETPLSVRMQFRQLSRQVLSTVNVPELHQKRIRVAAQFHSSEAVQGALADYFYTCWYEIISENSKSMDILKDVKHKLNAQVVSDLYACIDKAEYLHRISRLGTGWSVFVTPSMDVAKHRLRTTKQNTLHLVDSVIQQLTYAREMKQQDEIVEIENGFFEHCLVCDDLMAFMKVWFKLNKLQWHFDDRWQDCRMQLEKMNESNHS